MYLEEILAGGKSFFTNIHVLSVIKQGISAIRNKEPAGELVLLKYYRKHTYAGFADGLAGE